MDLERLSLIKVMHRILDWNRFRSAHAAPQSSKRLILGNKSARARSLSQPEVQNGDAERALKLVFILSRRSAMC